MSRTDLVNPATWEIIGSFEDPTDKDIQKSYDEAKRAQVAWAFLPFAQRAKIVAKFSDLLQEEKSRLALILSQEMGKPITQARSEIEATSRRILFFLEHTERELSEKVVLENSNFVEKISFEPLGVILNISAWNYPYFVGTNVFIPALLTGNAVLYKPSELCLKTGFELGELFRKAGLPQGVFTSMLGGKELGAKLVALEGLGGVFFTGSKQAGGKILSETCKRFISTNLEMGGKDPAYVLDDVDVDMAAKNLADGVLYNCGQSCCSVERIYVHKKVYETFCESLVKYAKEAKMGDPLSESTYLGPLARKEQIAVLDGQVADALAKGGRELLKGGPVPEMKGNFYRPVVIADAHSEMALMQEESFGPIIGVEQVADDQEALLKMNANSYGLTASIYGRDVKRAQKLMSQLDFGTVYFNCCDRISPKLPWSGRKNSGLGLTLSYLGIETFLRPKAWHLNLG